MPLHVPAGSLSFVYVIFQCVIAFLFCAVFPSILFCVSLVAATVPVSIFSFDGIIRNINQCWVYSFIFAMFACHVHQLQLRDTTSRAYKVQKRQKKTRFKLQYANIRYRVWRVTPESVRDRRGHRGKAPSARSPAYTKCSRANLKKQRHPHQEKSVRSPHGSLTFRFSG